MDRTDRRAFLRLALKAAGGMAVGGMAAGGLTIARPFQAFASRSAAGLPSQGEGYGELVDMGDLSLPRGFDYRIISRQGDVMSDGNPTPGIFDGMGALRGPGNTTILIRNHENRRRRRETPVVVPEGSRYDSDPSYNAGVTKLVVAPDGGVVESFAVVGGTSTNCSGGVMPWGSWISCEEVFEWGAKPHGYIFEVDATTAGPVDAVPMKHAGRFVHEGVAWHGGALHETEHQKDAAFYRYVPEQQPRQAGDLASSGGQLQALRIVGSPKADTRRGWPVGEPFAVDWVDIGDYDSKKNAVRYEAQRKGAAIFSETEGITVGGDRVYFDCTSGGAAGLGQVWELDPSAQTLSLIYESTAPKQLKKPDSLVVTPAGDVLLCEDSDRPPEFLRGLTPDGQIFNFARANRNETELAGACFDPDGHTLYVNQEGDREGKFRGVTYAIRGPWDRQEPPRGVAALA